MAGISQNLKATITFGGNIDSSWKRSSKDLQKNLKAVEKESERLTKDQTKLTSEIKKAKLAGNSIGDLKRQYSSVTREIRKTEVEQQKLNRQIQRSERIQAFKGKAGGLFRRGLNVGGQLGGMVAPGLGIGGGGVVATALASLIAPAATNAETARQTGVARSYGVDVETYNAWDSLAKQYDMTGENFGDLFEEYLHKAGEYKQNGKQSSLQDAFDTLGFKAGDMAGLSDMAQFNKIIERALSLKDESKASFALDSLFGGEASKLLMLVKQSGRSYRELMDEQHRYNLVTKAGAAGAVEGNKAVENLKTVLFSAGAEISGQLGNQLSPAIRELTGDLAEWFKGGGINKVVNFLRDDLYPGVMTFGQGVVYVGKIIYALAKKLSWLLPDERGDQKNVLKSLAMTGSVDIARMTAKRNGQEEWFDQQLKRHPELPEQVKKSYTDTRGFFSDDDETFDKALDPYLTAKKESLPDFTVALKKNAFISDASSDKPDASIKAPVLFPPLPHLKSELFDFKTDAVLNEPNLANGQSGRNWGSLSERVDSADIQQKQFQMTDNRKFDYHFEINGAQGQSERGIADEVEAITKTNPAFTGDNSMLDGGAIW